MKERYKNNTTTTMSTTSQQTNNTVSSSTIGTTNNNNNNNESIENQNFLSNPYNSNNFMAPAIGSVVRCTMCLGNIVQGKVLAYDQQTKMLALRVSVNGKQNLWDISMINIGWCSNLDVIEEANEPPETLPSLNLQKLARRTRLNIENKNKEINALGNGVPTVAQHLYFTILKTLNEVSWDDKKIVIMNSVIIEPPYEVNNCCSRSGDNSQALEHVKKIVKKFHEDYKSQQTTTKSSENNNEDKTKQLNTDLSSSSSSSSS